MARFRKSRIWTYLVRPCIWEIFKFPNEMKMKFSNEFLLTSYTTHFKPQFSCKRSVVRTHFIRYLFQYIGLATKWLRILSIPPNDKIRNHLVANPILLRKESHPSHFHVPRFQNHPVYVFLCVCIYTCIYIGEVSRGHYMGWPRITPGRYTNASVYSFNVYLRLRGHTWRLLINKGTCSTVGSCRLCESMEHTRYWGRGGRCRLENVLRQRWGRFEGSGERWGERFWMGRDTARKISRCVFLFQLRIWRIDLWLGEARGVCRVLGLGYLWRWKWRTMRTWTTTTLFRGGGWSMSSVLGNEFHSYGAWYFGKEYFPGFRTVH